MAKKWNEFTVREKVIGVAVAIFAVFAIGGVANGIGGAGNPAPASTSAVVTYSEVVETETIPFTKLNKDDSSMALGTTSVTTTGVDGVKTKTYKVTLENGTEKTRELIKEEVTTPAVDEITSVGTYVAPVKQVSSNCDPNYSGCVPIASDVDCAGGSGNGPAYVSGPVYVIGSDIYDLDRDGNGVGCE
jgi:hypothetical protein